MSPRSSEERLRGFRTFWTLREVAIYVVPSKAQGPLLERVGKNVRAGGSCGAVPACKTALQLGLLTANVPSSRVGRGSHRVSSHSTLPIVCNAALIAQGLGEVCADVCVAESMCVYKCTCACVCTRMWRPEDILRYCFSGAILSFCQ